MISAEQFNDYAQAGYNRIPLYRCVSADLDTPLSAWLKLANGPHTFLLESVEGGARWGRYSIIGLSADMRFHISGREVREFNYNELVDSYQTEDMLTTVEAIKNRYKVPEIDELPGFSGGLNWFGTVDTQLTGTFSLAIIPSVRPCTCAVTRRMPSAMLASSGVGGGGKSTTSTAPRRPTIGVD